jgi:cysteine synthase
VILCDTHDRFQGVSRLIGNTPLLAIEFRYKKELRVLYAKAENLNMTGSIKDRMAIHILREGYASRALAPGAEIVEATSGNTGIAFAAIGRALGHPVTIYMPDWMSKERIDLVRSLGATIHLVTKEEGGFLGSIEMAENRAREREQVFLPRQFSNEANVQAHTGTTAPEIWWQMRFNGLRPDAFVAGVGTGGTIMGVGQFLREQNREIKLHPLEPSNSPTLSKGRKVGKHRIQGISDEFIPSIVDLSSLDSVISVPDGDSILMAQKLASTLGLGVGISSGANFLGALLAQSQMGAGAVVATVFPDDNKKYLSTDLLKEEPVEADYLSPDIELLSFRTFKRVCHTCCDPLECAQNRGIDELGDTLPPCPRRGEKLSEPRDTSAIES